LQGGRGKQGCWLGQCNCNMFDFNKIVLEYDEEKNRRNIEERGLPVPSGRPPAFLLHPRSGRGGGPRCLVFSAHEADDRGFYIQRALCLISTPPTDNPTILRAGFFNFGEKYVKPAKINFALFAAI